MALTVVSLETLRNLLATIPHRPVRLLTAGYPDLLLPRDYISQAFGPAFADKLQVRPDSDAIIRWHNVGTVVDKIYETRQFFALLGVEVTFLDIVQVRGDEVLQDLNGPLKPELAQQFDIVYDGGTMEHCFNVAQGIANLLGMAKVGGYIVHSNPFNLPNHGFFNFNPTFYADFYEDNGHTLVEQIRAIANGIFDRGFVVVPKTARFKSSLPEATLMVVAQKQNDYPPIWPTQTKYKKNPSLAG